MHIPYATPIEVQIIGGYAVSCTIHHNGQTLDAIELDDGTMIASGWPRSQAHEGEPLPHRQIFGLIAAEVLRRYGSDLRHLEYDCTPPVREYVPAE